MSNVDALLAEIWKDPASDAPRLVLADQYEQDGDLERANFIRLQIERANLPSWEARASALELQERALVAKHGEAWRAHLPQLPGVQWGSFRRGFIRAVAFDDVDNYVAHHEECARRVPMQGVALPWPRSGTRPKLGTVSNVEELTMFGTVMEQDDMKWLAGCQVLSTIRSLNLIDSELRTGWAQLLKSKHLGALEALRLPRSHVGNAGITKLAASTTMPKLAELDLSVGADEELGSGRGYGRRAASVTSKGILELAAWKQLAQIHTLDVSGAKLGSEGTLMLLASQHTKALRTLRMRDIKDSDWDMDDSLGAFKAGPAGTLDELDISRNDLDPDAAHFMAEAKALRELKVLRMAGVRSNSFGRFAQASWVRSLRVLQCDEAVLPVFLARSPEQLHTIEIGPTATSLSQVVRHLAFKPPPALATLDLRESRIDDEGLRKLGELELPKLTTIKLPPTRRGFSLVGIKALAESKLGSQLVSLDAGAAEFDRLPEPDRLDVGDGDYEGPFRYL